MSNTLWCGSSQITGTSVETLKSIQDSLYAGDIPFKFGVDSSGKYGYYKNGEDIITPFNSSSAVNCRYINNEAPHLISQLLSNDATITSGTDAKRTLYFNDDIAYYEGTGYLLYETNFVDLTDSDYLYSYANARLKDNSSDTRFYYFIGLIGEDNKLKATLYENRGINGTKYYNNAIDISNISGVYKIVYELYFPSAGDNWLFYLSASNMSQPLYQNSFYVIKFNGTNSTYAGKVYQCQLGYEAVEISTIGWKENVIICNDSLNFTYTGQNSGQGATLTALKDIYVNGTKTLTGTSIISNMFWGNLIGQQYIIYE